MFSEKPFSDSNSVVGITNIAYFVLGAAVFAVCQRTSIENGDPLTASYIHLIWILGISNTIACSVIFFLLMNAAADRSAGTRLPRSALLRRLIQSFGQTFLSLAISCIIVSIGLTILKPYPALWGPLGINGVIFYSVLIATLPIACTAHFLGKDRRFD